MRYNILYVRYFAVSNLLSIKVNCNNSTIKYNNLIYTIIIDNNDAFLLLKIF